MIFTATCQVARFFLQELTHYLISVLIALRFSLALHRLGQASCIFTYSISLSSKTVTLIFSFLYIIYVAVPPLKKGLSCCYLLSAETPRFHNGEW